MEVVDCQQGFARRLAKPVSVRYRCSNRCELRLDAENFMRVQVGLLALLVLPVAGISFAQGDASKFAETRKAIERSLPHLEEQGVAWMRDRGCVTCHHTPFLIWTHGEADRRGVPIDRTKLDSWSNWALLNITANTDPNADQGADTLSQLLLGRDESSPWLKKPPKWHSRNADPYEHITKSLLAAQSADGFWTAGGQSANPNELPTSWAILALAARDDYMNTRFPKRETSDPIVKLTQPNDKAIPGVREKALVWLRAQDSKSTHHLTEAVVSRLLVERKFGKPDEAKELLEALLARQNADGGWSADIDLKQPSDAFATGQAIFALTTSNPPGEQEKEAVSRAMAFLIQSQESDGSWTVRATSFHATKGADDAREKSKDQIYSYWGSAWATLGLLHTLPLAQKP